MNISLTFVTTANPVLKKENKIHKITLAIDHGIWSIVHVSDKRVTVLVLLLCNAEIHMSDRPFINEYESSHTQHLR